MPGKQAKVVTPPMLKRMLRHVSLIFDTCDLGVGRKSLK